MSFYFPASGRSVRDLKKTGTSETLATVVVKLSFLFPGLWPVFIYLIHFKAARGRLKIVTSETLATAILSSLSKLRKAMFLRVL